MSEISLPVRIEKGDTYDLHVMWDLHHKCNFHCSYCNPGLSDGSVDFLNIDLMKDFVDKVELHYIKNLGFKNILFSVTGGEPTLWKDFGALLEYSQSKGIKFGLTTNGSVGLSFWKKTSRFFDYICLSFHPEFANADHFLQVFKYLHDDPETVIPAVRLMMSKEDKYWDKSIKVMDQVIKFPNWTYECVYILDNYATDSVTKTSYPSKEKEEFLNKHAFNSQFLDNSVVKVPEVNFVYKVFYENGHSERLDENKLINNNHNNFFGWKCSIGLEGLFIDALGYVWRSGCTPGKRLGQLGSILKPNTISFPTSPIICNLNNGCFCPTDIRISKEKLKNS